MFFGSRKKPGALTARREGVKHERLKEQSTGLAPDLAVETISDKNDKLKYGKLEEIVNNYINVAAIDDVDHLNRVKTLLGEVQTANNPDFPWTQALQSLQEKIEKRLNQLSEKAKLERL